VLPLLSERLAGLGCRRDRELERDLPGLLEAVARSLRTGATLPLALEEAAGGRSAAADELRAALAEVDAGRPLAEALAGWAQRRPLPAVRLASAALVVALGVGGAPARAVDGVAATLRERVEVDREVRALATQARTSAAVIVLAPLAFALLGALGDDRAAAFLFTTAPGLACQVSGLALDGLGAWWMARLTRSP